MLELITDISIVGGISLDFIQFFSKLICLGDKLMSVYIVFSILRFQYICISVIVDISACLNFNFNAVYIPAINDICLFCDYAVIQWCIKYIEFLGIDLSVWIRTLILVYAVLHYLDISHISSQWYHHIFNCILFLFVSMCLN